MIYDTLSYKNGFNVWFMMQIKPNGLGMVSLRPDNTNLINKHKTLNYGYR